MRTAEECSGFSGEPAQAKWWPGEDPAKEEVSVKANITCWHSAALSYASWRDWSNATYACEQIKTASAHSRDQDMLYREYVLCITAISKRLHMDVLCERIDDPNFQFEKESCERKAQPPHQICGGPIFALLALGASSLFFRRNGRKGT